MSEPKRYRVDIINVDPYHAELDDMGDRSGILPFVLAEDYDREHELRLQAERERDGYRRQLLSERNLVDEINGRASSLVVENMQLREDRDRQVERRRYVERSANDQGMQACPLRIELDRLKERAEALALVLCEVSELGSSGRTGHFGWWTGKTLQVSDQTLQRWNDALAAYRKEYGDG